MFKSWVSHQAWLHASTLLLSQDWGGIRYSWFCKCCVLSGWNLGCLFHFFIFIFFYVYRLYSKVAERMRPLKMGQARMPSASPCFVQFRRLPNPTHITSSHSNLGLETHCKRVQRGHNRHTGVERCFACCSLHCCAWQGEMTLLMSRSLACIDALRLAKCKSWVVCNWIDNHNNNTFSFSLFVFMLMWMQNMLLSEQWHYFFIYSLSLGYFQCLLCSTSKVHQPPVFCSYYFKKKKVVVFTL